MEDPITISMTVKYDSSKYLKPAFEDAYKVLKGDLVAGFKLPLPKQRNITWDWKQRSFTFFWVQPRGSLLHSQLKSRADDTPEHKALFKRLSIIDVVYEETPYVGDPLQDPSARPTNPTSNVYRSAPTEYVKRPRVKSHLNPEGGFIKVKEEQAEDFILSAIDTVSLLSRVGPPQPSSQFVPSRKWSDSNKNSSFTSETPDVHTTRRKSPSAENGLEPSVSQPCALPSIFEMPHSPSKPLFIVPSAPSPRPSSSGSDMSITSPSIARTPAILPVQVPTSFSSSVVPIPVPVPVPNDDAMQGIVEHAHQHAASTETPGGPTITKTNDQLPVKDGISHRQALGTLKAPEESRPLASCSDVVEAPSERLTPPGLWNWQPRPPQSPPRVGFSDLSADIKPPWPSGAIQPTSSSYTSMAIETSSASPSKTEGTPNRVARWDVFTSSQRPGSPSPSRTRDLDTSSRTSQSQSSQVRLDNHPYRRPPPKPSDGPEINQLTRELWDIRREMTKHEAKEKSIRKRLKEMNALKSADDPNETFTQIALRSKLESLERELEDERRRRSEAERSLDDVRQECRAPFIVPALLEAFITISKLSNKALQPES
ncbi:hypothetical protein HGRIS_006716 [Hohenbuehelia grisea]|uniref:Uncharacterized protein n=1 Tax=Hohenbuehelia grisea TaxID=104357 RepID=A0ABR3JA64_9AGAR